MTWRALADLVAVVHGALLLFFLAGGFLAWRWPRLIWFHLAIVVWNVVITLVSFTCPVTATEQYFRRLGGESRYRGGFVRHYFEGHLWPVGATPLVTQVGFAVVVIAYVGFFVVRHRQKAKVRGDSVGPRT
ncbi:putative membrane protein [Kribbella aluminosa]|uniref:Membrane protein n=1 Tax=Kribbella aluminosa TaxID=416017 RepID=A0ABS4UQ94_9ACTN|nr:DUF2784 domain-containing protein [Kribbella aluminosa]MBP2353810.1 putative membrane protein [Kribbella aluminosa]